MNGFNIIKAQLLINHFKHISLNQPVHIAAVNYVLSPFEGNMNILDPMGLKLYLRETKEIDKENDKIYI